MEGGDVYVPPFCVRAEDFTPEEAAEILQSHSSDKIISVPPCEPKAGEAYLLSQIVFVVKVSIISVWYGFLDARFVTRYFYLMPG